MRHSTGVVLLFLFFFASSFFHFYLHNTCVSGVYVPIDISS